MINSTQIIYIAELLKYILYDFKYIYNLVKIDITIIECNAETEEAFKNCKPSIKSIRKIDGTTIDDAEDSDLFMPIYNLLE